MGLALRQYHQFEQRLHQELGIQPSPETKAIYDEILRQQGSSVSVTTSFVAATTPSNLLPFIGRDDFLHELSVIGDDVKAGHDVTVLIQGEGGIGKTRLLNEFSSRLIPTLRFSPQGLPFVWAGAAFI